MIELLASFYDDMLSSNYELKFIESLADFQRHVRAFVLSSDRIPDVLIADLSLPDGKFTSVLESREYSHFFKNCPFVVVSGVDEKESLEACFHAGAKDFITKPFSRNILLVKLDRLMTKRAAEDSLAPGLDAVSMCARGPKGVSNPLTSKEFQIMTILMETHPDCISRETLTTRIWSGLRVSSKTVDVHMFNLRRKLKPAGLMVGFDTESGYALSPQTGPEL